jgi:very-short-patch-repair endonuclease
MYNDQLQKERRRELRKNQTEVEKILWRKIRNRQINNLKFHRQYSAGHYILDFFCPEIRLAIELDGNQHKDAVVYDKERELFLKDKDIYMIRFWNYEILKDVENVVEKICDKIDLFQKSLPLDKIEACINK